MTNANISNPESFQNGASMLHEQALFNPVPDRRAQALTAARKQSAYSAEQWAKFDVAAGIRSKESVTDDETLELAADTTMPVESWVEYDDTTLEEHDGPTNTLQRLISMGFSISSSLARYAYVRPMSYGGEMEADVNMNARARSRQDLPTFGLDGVGQPIVHSDWEIDSREYQASQTYGEGLDASVAADAREAIEQTEDDILFNSWSGTVGTQNGDFGVRGLNTDAEMILPATATAGWEDPDAVISTLEEVQIQIENQGDEGEAPSPRQVGAILLVPTEQMTAIQVADYETAATDEPLAARLDRKFPYLELVEAPRLPSGNLVWMLNDTRYFSVVVAQGVTSTSWQVDGGFGRRSKMLASRMPWVRRQPDNIYGIVRVTGA